MKQDNIFLRRLQNEGKVDRAIRLILGIVLALVATLYTTGITQIVLYFVALLLVATSFSGVCIAYKTCGINTK